MNMCDLIKSRRTIRRFKQEKVKDSDLLELIDCARLAPTGGNLQPLRYFLITDESVRKEIYPYIKYAGYIPEWNPTFEECATAFIAVLNDTDIKPTKSSEFDSGASLMSISLACESMKLGSCILGAINREKIHEILSLDSKLDLMYLIAIGHPDQTGESFDNNDSVKYYFDEKKNVHVPKRSMDKVLIKDNN